MQLYKTTATIDRSEDGTKPVTKTIWSGTMAAASGDRAGFIAAGAKRKDVNTEDINIPTDKSGLLNFLNGAGL